MTHEPKLTYRKMSKSLIDQFLSVQTQNEVMKTPTHRYQLSRLVTNRISHDIEKPNLLNA
jgi:hypothetical protein